jgi:hypothetical protein
MKGMLDILQKSLTTTETGKKAKHTEFLPSLAYDL